MHVQGITLDNLLQIKECIQEELTRHTVKKGQQNQELSKKDLYQVDDEKCKILREPKKKRIAKLDSKKKALKVSVTPELRRNTRSTSKNALLFQLADENKISEEIIEEQKPAENIMTQKSTKKIMHEKPTEKIIEEE